MGKGERRKIVFEVVDDKESIDLDELNEHIMLMEAVRSHLDVEWAESVGVFEARDGHELFGFASMVAYLKDQCRMSGARAKTSVVVARAARRVDPSPPPRTRTSGTNGTHTRRRQSPLAQLALSRPLQDQRTSCIELSPRHPPVEGDHRISRHQCETSDSHVTWSAD